MSGGPVWGQNPNNGNHGRRSRVVSGGPQTEAGRDALRYLSPGAVGGTGRNPEWEASILAIEAEAIAQERERTVVAMENEGVVTWGDDGHRARFLQGADR